MVSDFTKEELLDLYAAIRHCYKQGIDLPSDTDTERFAYDLMEKINLMIDNYCEHEIPVTIDQVLKNLNALIKVQSYNGNYDYDPYMFGIANGLILARSCIDGKDPEFLTKPEKWIEDMPKTELIDVGECNE